VPVAVARSSSAGTATAVRFIAPVVVPGFVAGNLCTPLQSVTGKHIKASSSQRCDNIAIGNACANNKK
jgi:hypothetical protein